MSAILPRWIHLGLLSASIALVAPLRGQNIIRNAGFESPLYANGSQTASGTGVLDDWDFITGSGSVVTDPPSIPNLLPAQVGIQQYYMETSGQLGQIQQISLSLTAGETYQFSFYLSGLQNSPNAQITAQFSAPDSLTLTNTFSVMTTGWILQTWDFTPSSTTDYTLLLSSPNGYNSSIDDLSLMPLSAVPEPSSAALGFATAGLAAAAWWRRKRAVTSAG
jgi:hypothetical protein